MNKGIEARELIELDNQGIVIRATYHKTCEERLGEKANLKKRDRVGVLFLSGILATRASHGDAAVYWAESFAQYGYPSFRLDLPGYGDSDGDPPPEWHNFVCMGGHASIVAAKIDELVTRFSLSGVVVAGHCAGALSAIDAAASTGHCVGLVLMEPYFHVPEKSRPKILQRLNFWALQSQIGGCLSNVYDLIKEVHLIIRGDIPPKNANIRLLHRLKEVASRGLPILILRAPARRAPGVRRRVGEFDYVDWVLRLAGCRSRVVVEIVGGASHSFADRLGRTAVRQHTENWLEVNFPLSEYREQDAKTLRLGTR